MSVAIGYVPGAFGQGGDDPEFLRKLVAVGDKYKYDSIWLRDRIVSDRFSLGPMIAKQVATLDYLSQGRFFPAVGLGQEEPEEYEACGVPKEDRAQRTDEAIVLMRRLWEEDSVTHEGRFFSCHDVSITPKPFLKPSPPVWIGGRSAAAARRVGRVGDGWLVSGATPEEVRKGREVLFETAEKYEREIEEDHVGVLMGYYVTSDRDQGVTKTHQFVTRHRPDVPFTEYSAVGAKDQVGELIQIYVDAGAYKFVVRPLCAGEESMEQLEIMGQEILPLFHG